MSPVGREAARAPLPSRPRVQRVPVREPRDSGAAGKVSSSPRPSWDEYFLQLARQAATRSTCLRRQVGAVLVRDKRLLATGYNGAPARHRPLSRHRLPARAARHPVGRAPGAVPRHPRRAERHHPGRRPRGGHRGRDALHHAAPLHPVRQDADQLRRQGDPLPRGLPGRALARHARRGRRHAHQGGPAIDGLDSSLLEPDAHGRAGLRARRRHRPPCDAAHGAARARRRRRRPPRRGAAHARPRHAAARRARHLHRLAGPRAAAGAHHAAGLGGRRRRHHRRRRRALRRPLRARAVSSSSPASSSPSAWPVLRGAHHPRGGPFVGRVPAVPRRRSPCS